MIEQTYRISIKNGGIVVSSNSDRANAHQANEIAKVFWANWPEDFHKRLYVDISDGERQISYRVEWAK